MEKVEKNLVNYMKTFEENNNKEHQSMKEHMCKIEDRNMKEHEEMRLNHIKNEKDLGYMIGSLRRMETKLDEFIKAAEKKFAPIWVARALTWTAAVAGTAIVGALMSLILIK